jgi:hypothetical protein
MIFALRQGAVGLVLVLRKCSTDPGARPQREQIFNILVTITSGRAVVCNIYCATGASLRVPQTVAEQVRREGVPEVLD